MKDSELESRIQKSLDEGFTKKEVIRALKDDGYDEQRIRRIFRDLESDSAGNSKGQSASSSSRQPSTESSQVSNPQDLEEMSGEAQDSEDVSETGV